MAKTKVEYDVSQAIAELKKLADAAGKGGKEQIKSFDGVNKGLDKMEDGLGRANPAAGKLVGTLRNVAGSAGPAGVALIGVGTALAGIASNLINVPDLLADSASEIDAFTSRTDQILFLKDAIGDVDDALKRAGFKESLDRLNLQQAQTVDRQIEVNNARRTEQEKLNLAKSRLRDLESAVKASAKKRADIEKQAAQGIAAAEIADQTRGATAGGAVVNLAARADQAAFEGDIELAQKLVDEAKKRSEELGNHSFFTDRIATAQESINAKLTSQAGASKAAEAAAQRRLDIQKQQVGAIQEELDRLTDIKNLIADTQFAIRSERRNVKDSTRTQQRAEAIGDSSDEITSAIENLSKALNTERGGFESVKDLFAGLTSALGRGGARFQGEFQEATTFDDRLSDALAQVETRTPEGVQAGLQGIQDVLESARALAERTRNADGQVAGLGPIFKALDTAFTEAAGKLAPAVSRAVDAGVQPGQRIDEAAIPQVQARINAQQRAAGIVKDSLESAADSSQRIKDNLNQIQGGQVPGAQAPGTEFQQFDRLIAPTPGANQGASATINVPVTVQGGLIDRDVIQQISDIVATEVRKLTSRGVA